MPLIECKAGPTETPVAGTMYNFQRDKHGRYVCEVYNPKHIECFLAVVHFQQVEADPAPEETEAEVVIEPPVAPVAPVVTPPAEPVIASPASVVTPPAPPSPPAPPTPRVRMAAYAPPSPVVPAVPDPALSAPFVPPVPAAPVMPAAPKMPIDPIGLGQTAPAGDAALTPPAATATPPVDPAVVRAQLAEKAATRRATRRKKK